VRSKADKSQLNLPQVEKEKKVKTDKLRSIGKQFQGNPWSHSVHAAIDRYLPPGRPTAANLPHAASAVDRRDRQTDGRRTIA